MRKYPLIALIFMPFTRYFEAKRREKIKQRILIDATHITTQLGFSYNDMQRRALKRLRLRLEMQENIREIEQKTNAF